MSDVVRCLNCGIDNRLPETAPGSRGAYRCGSCRQAICWYGSEESYALESTSQAEEDGELSQAAAVLCWTAAMLLLATLLPWSEELYDAARMSVFGASAVGLFLAYQNRARHWIFMLAGLVLLYAPMMRSVFDRAPWRLIDVGAAIVIAAAPFCCRAPRKLRKALEMTPSEAMRHADRSIWPA